MLKDRVPMGPNGPIGVVVDPRTWRAVPYLLVSLALGTGWFVLLVTAVPLSLALVLVWVGLPLLLATMLLWRGAAMLERRLLGLTLGVRIRDPYRRRPRRGLVRWVVTDPATWKDLGYLLLYFPLSLVEFVASATLWALTVGLLSAPLTLALGERPSFAGVVLADGWPQSVLAGVAGVVALVVTLYAVKGMAWLHGTLAALLLGGSEVERLRASRKRGIDAAEAERRRIERDLHDGAQQRLLAVAVDLGRAQAKFDAAPEEARELLVQAHVGTRQAIAELRDLARGIHPAILTERGLDAALSALAARAPFRVDVSMEIIDRPPPAVESIAYFTVAEALTNMARHSGATEASVRVTRDDQVVIVEVLDNGVGGAAVRHGGGLSGLADRAATIDGLLTVNSPAGGPTLLRAELPCEW
ncbi:sensor histidine kinase [Nonomuraea soli]|uniref:histidine kinase n=1 Tax=Nonomuraea soli TaxID=1032476 RepID=A0A7W0HRK6_9ACTN|nr:sensor domain-containing protein [Nonomuraea soli]MBA2893035.1 signal transduction histidine kinase [Nonomuraea soli]